METPSKVGWIYLPQDVSPQSLWACLHDGELLTVQSDLLARSLKLEIDLPHLRPGENTGPEARYFLEISGVTVLSVEVSLSWPGTRPETKHLSVKEQIRIQSEFSALGRTESMRWSDYAENFREDAFFQIMNADLAERKDSCALRLEGYFDGETYCGNWWTISVCAQSYRLSRGRSEDISIKEFIQIGQDYWDTFGKL